MHSTTDKSVTLICRPKKRCLRMCSRRRQRHWRLTFFFFFLLYREFKSTWMLFPKSRACATSVCEWGGVGGTETAFTTSLHIVMRMRRGENEQRKPDLRGESELDRQSSFFLALIFTMRMQKLASLSCKNNYFFTPWRLLKKRETGGGGKHLEDC